jgi:hypothetical protein
METTKDDSPKFTIVTKQKQQTEQQADSAALKRSMSDLERDSEVIDVDNDITSPGACKQINRTGVDLVGEIFEYLR